MPKDTEPLCVHDVVSRLQRTQPEFLVMLADGTPVTSVTFEHHPTTYKPVVVIR